jgi:hypothetical protein
VHVVARAHDGWPSASLKRAHSYLAHRGEWAWADYALCVDVDVRYGAVRRNNGVKAGVKAATLVPQGCSGPRARHVQGIRPRALDTCGTLSSTPAHSTIRRALDTCGTLNSRVGTAPLA